MNATTTLCIYFGLVLTFVFFGPVTQLLGLVQNLSAAYYCCCVLE